MAVNDTRGSLRERLGRVIHDSDTPAGRRFDLWLIWVILFSIGLVMLESVRAVQQQYGTLLLVVEWAVTILFTVEYALRLWTARDRVRWAFSFYGVVDLLAILPTYLSIIWPGLQALAVLRAVRLMRIFRILGLFNYVREARLLLLSLAASRHRIIVFMLAVLALVSVFGTIMYIVEPKEAGFTSIPRSIYWAIVTLTTVGYGDIAPVTTLGQIIASGIMLLGYAIIAIPTGIVTVEMARQTRNLQLRACPHCGMAEHLTDANFCRICATRLDQPVAPVSSPPR
ncbi:MAG: ion transporter [Flavobacteriales bacterium]|nr:ion transporter [Flavobacteriales bacterium]